MNIKSTVTLSNGVKMPKFGFGVWQISDGGEVADCVCEALKVGYALIDTAAIYDNEKGVGEGLKDFRRDEFFLTTKVWNEEQGYDTTLKAFETSIKKLEVDFVDLYLVHWPVQGKFADTWRAMERLYDDGLVRAIGVSNFTQFHIHEIYKTAHIPPMVNQIEISPFITRESLREFCKQEGIVVEAYSPLGRAKILKTPQLIKIGEKYGKSPAQIILRWHLQNDIIPIPKSSHAQRIKENADIFDFELSMDEIKTISALNQNKHAIKQSFFQFDEHNSVIL
ncbi:MAG: aldo/keto reductase [Campylobacteraceae bacterium]|jgi:diketogulonate reductase-like aldo/keto reductase|nr:aldo/keto reductase [Campylobacteraceae bacterium]